jgi:hypothetical protein
MSPNVVCTHYSRPSGVDVASLGLDLSYFSIDAGRFFLEASDLNLAAGYTL